MRANFLEAAFERNACSAKKYEEPAPGYSFDNSAYAIAVARQRSTAAKMPNHMPCAAIGWPYADWMKKVSQRKAPGAISAIALTVNPVRPSVEGGFGAVVAGDIRHSFVFCPVSGQGLFSNGIPPVGCSPVPCAAGSASGRGRRSRASRE